MKHSVLPCLVVSLAGVLGSAQDFTEPKTGVRLPTTSSDGQMVLLGAGVRTKTFVVKVKVYVAGLYVARDAVAKHATPSPELFSHLVWGDFPKQIVLHFVRNVGKGRIQDAMRGSLPTADKNLTEQFVSYFPEVREGQECTLRWGKGGVLEVTMNGERKPDIASKEFAGAVFAIFLGEKPIQEDLKQALVARLPI